MTARSLLLAVPLLMLALGGCAIAPNSSQSLADKMPVPAPQGAVTAVLPDAALPLPSGFQLVSGPASGQTGQAETQTDQSKERPASDAKEAAPEEKKIKPAIEVRGRIQAEAALINQSARDQAIIGTVQDAVGFRRARLGAQGTVGEQVRWVAEFDFAGGDVSFKDVFIGVDKLPVVRELRVGNFAEPFSLEGATSSNVITFVERSPAMVIDPGRHWGVGMFSYTDDERMTLQAGVFRSGSNSTGNDISNDNDMQYTARVTGLAWYDPDSYVPSLLHLGGAFSQQFANNGTITYNQGPQSSLLTISDNPSSPFVPTITIKANHQQLYNLQAAAVYGPLSVQAEWNAAQIQQVTGGPVFFHGGYVYASFFLTGEHREYLPKEGAFGVTKVHCPFMCLKGAQMLGSGPGAWELAARFAYMDYSSANLPDSNGLRVGDRIAEFTAGVNWYLNDNTRMMFNYVHSVPVDPNFGPSFADAFFLSCQIFW